jgi:hypothetical protein
LLDWFSSARYRAERQEIQEVSFMNTRMTYVLVVAAAISTSSALAQTASQAAETKKNGETEKKEPSKAVGAPASAAGGLVVFIDPVTGKIRQPDAAEIGRLVSPEGVKLEPKKPLVTKQGPGGAVGVVLDSSYESYMVVTRQPDGRLAMECVTGEKAAQDAVTNGAKSSKKPEAKEAPDVR